MRTLPPVWVVGLRARSNSVASSTNFLSAGLGVSVVFGAGGFVLDSSGLGFEGVSEAAFAFLRAEGVFSRSNFWASTKR